MKKNNDREILFRGKRIDNGEWVYGCLAQAFANTDYWSIMLQGNLAFTVIPETVGQFTGLTDKNGKKIFEGDIVKATLMPIYKDASYAIGLVIFENGTFKIAVYKNKNTIRYREYTIKEDVKSYSIENNFIDRNYCIEVIGNIHDNPELLENDYE